VKPTWDLDHIRKEVGTIIAEYKMSYLTALKDYPEQLLKVQECFMNDHVRIMKNRGVKTPIDMVRYLAELTVNLAGGEIRINGDESSASIAYDSLPMWEEMKDKLDMSPAGKQQLADLSNAAIQPFAAQFGLKCSLEAKFDKPLMVLTFSVA